MGTFNKILSGSAILIGLYLFVSHANGSIKVINSISSAYMGGVKTLQGR